MQGDALDRWEQHRLAYEEMGRTDDQAYEDMIARRMLKGMQLHGKNKLTQFEEQHMGRAYLDNILLDRAKGALQEITMGTPHRVMFSSIVLDTAQVANHAQALERLRNGPTADEGWSVLLTLPKVSPNKSEGAAYAVWPDVSAFDVLTPPYQVITLKHDTTEDEDDLADELVTVQPIPNFIKQFTQVHEDG